MDWLDRAVDREKGATEGRCELDWHEQSTLSLSLSVCLSVSLFLSICRFSLTLSFSRSFCVFISLFHYSLSRSLSPPLSCRDACVVGTCVTTPVLILVNQRESKREWEREEERERGSYVRLVVMVTNPICAEQRLYLNCASCFSPPRHLWALGLHLIVWVFQSSVLNCWNSFRWNLFSQLVSFGPVP